MGSGSSDADRSDCEHHYRPLATQAPDGRLGYEYFATGEPRYGFRCRCGDVQVVTLHGAADRGWVEVLDGDDGAA